MRARIGRHVGLVRDHQHGDAASRLRSVSSSMISSERLAVEIAGRLVGEQHVGLGDDRAGDGDALLLAAGKLGRRMVPPVARARPCRARPSPPRAAAALVVAAIEQGQLDILERVVRASRLKPWKTKPR